MDTNRLKAMQAVAWNLKLEGRASRSECVDELIAEVQRLQTALRHVHAVMGPAVPPCCAGCEYEWTEALETVAAALKA